MFVSVVIPTYNKLPRLKLTLASIENQTLGQENFEVIIVDDCSTDDTEAFIASKTWPINLRCFRLDKNSGRSVARNIGIENSKGELIAFTDDDCLVSPDFLQNHIRLHKKNCVSHGAIWNLPFFKFFSDPANGILYKEFEGRDIANLGNISITKTEVKHNFQKIIKMGRKTKFEKQVEKCLADEQTAFHWLSCTGGNIAIEADLLKKAGGFDKQLGKPWGIEDIELGYRLHKNGVKFQYINDAPVYHIAHYRANSEELSKRAVEYMENKYPELTTCKLYENFFNGTLEYDLLVQTLKS